METTLTHTGKIFVDRKKKLEWLIVGDYGKEANLKANFLDLTKPIHGVQHKPVDLTEKCVITVSTQKGCQCNCKFCDVPKVPYRGDVTIPEFKFMISHALRDANILNTKRLNIHFARMGEPTFNMEVLTYTSTHLNADIARTITHADTIHPVVSTMLPKYNQHLFHFLKEWCEIKNIERNGEAGLQLSIQSTSDEQRDFQFNNRSLSLREISKIANKLPTPIGRKYTLNFAVTKDTILNPKHLTELFDPNHFLVKITPIHQTKAATTNKFDVSTTYHNYDVYEQFEKPLLATGWDVIVFVPSQEEDSDRITCGNALLGDKK